MIFTSETFSPNNTQLFYLRKPETENYIIKIHGRDLNHSHRKNLVDSDFANHTSTLVRRAVESVSPFLGQGD